MKNTDITDRVMFQIACREERLLRRNVFVSVVSISALLSLSSGVIWNIADTWNDSGLGYVFDGVQEEWSTLSYTSWSLYYFIIDELPLVVVGIISLGGAYFIACSTKFFTLNDKYKEIQKYKA